jgi:hypothetical protein
VKLVTKHGMNGVCRFLNRQITDSHNRGEPQSPRLKVWTNGGIGENKLKTNEKLVGASEVNTLD